MHKNNKNESTVHDGGDDDGGGSADDHDDDDDDDDGGGNVCHTCAVGQHDYEYDFDHYSNSWSKLRSDRHPVGWLLAFAAL